jgi:hypothetical protein
MSLPAHTPLLELTRWPITQGRRRSYPAHVWKSPCFPSAKSSAKKRAAISYQFQDAMNRQRVSCSPQDTSAIFFGLPMPVLPLPEAPDVRAVSPLLKAKANPACMPVCSHSSFVTTPAAPAPAPGLRLRLLPPRPPRAGPPLPPLAPPPPCFPPGGGLTNAKSTCTVWSSSFSPFAPSIAARASSSVAYSIRAYPYPPKQHQRLLAVWEGRWWGDAHTLTYPLRRSKFRCKFLISPNSPNMS